MAFLELFKTRRECFPGSGFPSGRKSDLETNSLLPNAYASSG